LSVQPQQKLRGHMFKTLFQSKSIFSKRWNGAGFQRISRFYLWS